MKIVDRFVRPALNQRAATDVKTATLPCQTQDSVSLASLHVQIVRKMLKSAHHAPQTTP